MADVEGKIITCESCQAVFNTINAEDFSDLNENPVIPMWECPECFTLVDDNGVIMDENLDDFGDFEESDLYSEDEVTGPSLNEPSEDETDGSLLN